MMQGATPAPAIGSVPFEAEQFTHATVLLNEAVDALDIKTDGTYIDCTFGRGGHSQKI